MVDVIIISSLALAVALIVVAIIIIIYYQEDEEILPEEIPEQQIVQTPPSQQAPPPKVCPKINISAIENVWRSSDWQNYQKAMNTQCMIDDSMKSLYGDVYNTQAAATYEILNPGCKAIENISLPPGKTLIDCDVRTTSPIFRESKVDPMNEGTCVLDPNAAQVFWAAPRNDVWELPARQYVCVPHKNKADCLSLSGAVGPDGTTPKLCLWTPKYVTGTFAQKAAYFYPASNKRDMLGPLQYDGGEVTGTGFIVDPGTQTVFATHETCEYVIQAAIAGTRYDIQYYRGSRVIDDITNINNMYKTILTEIKFAYPTYTVILNVAWAPSKYVDYINGVAARKYVPVCIVDMNNCVRDDPANGADPKVINFACGSCKAANLAARGVICPVTGGYAQC